jgi:methyl-accepting chemotaxis protein
MDSASQEISREVATILVVTEKGAREERLDNIRKHRDAYRKMVDQIKSASPSTRVQSALATLEEAIDEAKTANNQVIKLESDGKPDEAIRSYTSSCIAKTEKLGKVIDKLDEIIAEEAKQASVAAEAINATGKQISLALGLVAIIFAFGFGVVLAKGIAVPIIQTVKNLELVAEGDLRKDVSDDQLERKDEIGELARATQTLTKNLREMIMEVTNGTTVLGSASTELSSISEHVSRGAKEVESRATTVAAAAEESSANTTSVATAMEETTGSLTSVATATEEMSATIGEIAGNAEKARAISSEATSQAEAISSMMKELGRSAQDIDKVTEAITSISAQTNLLALNATIEAARAGAAGKGFAVVANEIKELAQQTASATEDIRTKISTIQASTGGAVADIERIAQVIKEVGDIVASIAASIDEQSNVTKNVAQNISQASEGVQGTNDRVGQTAQVAQSIARDIAQVNAIIAEVVTGGEQVRHSSSELTSLAEMLKTNLERFKTA